MTTTKRKKVVKYRGSHTHGCGSKKKRRGAGNRGGRGLAGSGKRAHHHKQRIFKIFGKDYFGKHGFHRANKKLKKAINISFIETYLEKLKSEKLITEKEGFLEIDFKKLKIDKLLSAGTPTQKYKILGSVSKKTQEKIESAGGQIVS
jgi:large subunit ribosomal protein L15